MLHRIHSQYFTPNPHHSFVLMSSFQADTAFGEEWRPRQQADIIHCVAHFAYAYAAQGSSASDAGSFTFIKNIAYIAFVTPDYVLLHLSHVTNAMLHTSHTCMQKRNLMSKTVRVLENTPEKSLAEKVAKMSATYRPDSQMLAHLADMPLLWWHKINPGTPFCVGDCWHSPRYSLSTRATYSEFLCKIW